MGSPCNGTAYAYRWKGCVDRGSICGDWKLIEGVSEGSYYPLPTSRRAVKIVGVQNAYGGVYFPPSGPPVEQLYNLSADPGEHHDLATNYTAVVTLIKAKISALQQQALAPCNIDGGSCYNQDDKATDVATANGGWMPWLPDP